MKNMIKNTLIGAVSMLAVAGVANAATVFIDPASLTVATNDEFMLTVKGTAFPNVVDPLWDPNDPFGPPAPAVGVTGGSITLTWDPNIINFSSVNLLDGFSVLGTSTLLPNQLSFTANQDFGLAAGTAFNFAAITFTAVAPPGTDVIIGLGTGGPWQLADFTEIGDPNVDPNGVTYEGAEITVNAVPVPAAVWLFGSGLLGLVGVARRQRQQRQPLAA